MVYTSMEGFSKGPCRKMSLLTKNIPYPPFSVTKGRLKGSSRESLFPRTLELVGRVGPETIVLRGIENFLSGNFSRCERCVLGSVRGLNCSARVGLLGTSSFKIPRLQPEIIVIKVEERRGEGFACPRKSSRVTPAIKGALCSLVTRGG